VITGVFRIGSRNEPDTFLSWRTTDTTAAPRFSSRSPSANALTRKQNEAARKLSLPGGVLWLFKKGR
jgi:hypothetical protein